MPRFTGGHRAKCNRHLERLNNHCRKARKSIVGPLPGTDSTFKWHERVHQWNVPVNIFVDGANIKTWSFELLEVCATFCHPIVRALGSTNFALVPGWNIPNWPTTFSFGADTSIVLQVETRGAIDGWINIANRSWNVAKHRGTWLTFV